MPSIFFASFFAWKDTQELSGLLHLYIKITVPHGILMTCSLIKRPISMKMRNHIAMYDL